MSVSQQDVIMSTMPDVAGVPLGEEVRIDDGEYAAVMRRANGGGAGTDAPVCAFNSSI